MVPERIKPYFKITHQKDDGENSLVEGVLTCCNDYAFKVFGVGEVKHSIFHGTYLLPENDIIVLEAHCQKCGKSITIFDNGCDGYDCYEKREQTQVSTKPLNCNKCQDNSYLISIKYEYPDEQELEMLEIEEADNAFTRIWVTLECNKCRAKYKNFIDYETA